MIEKEVEIVTWGTILTVYLRETLYLLLPGLSLLLMCSSQAIKAYLSNYFKSFLWTFNQPLHSTIIFEWNFHIYLLLVIFKCYLPFWFPPSHPFHPASIWELPHPPIHSHLTALAFSYAGASSLHRAKCLPSHWCQIRPSSATYTPGDMGLFMCIFLLVV